MSTTPTPTNGKHHSNGRRLTVAALAKAKQLPEDALRLYGLCDQRDGVGIPYYGEDGAELHVKRRTALKATDGSWWPSKVPLMAYGLWLLDRAQKLGLLYLVEGESDCWALWHHKQPALGLPGANSVGKTLTWEALVGIRTLYVCEEPDRGGKEFIKGVAAQLAALKWDGLAKVICMPTGCKDVADLHCLHPEPKPFGAALAVCVTAATTLPYKAQTAKPRLADTAALPAAPADKTAPAANGQHKPRYHRIAVHKPFPLDALPQPLRVYVKEAAAAIHCNPSFLALHALAVAASCIGNTRVIRLRRDWCEPAILWVAVVAESGTLKSPALFKTLGRLFKLQGRYIEEFKYEREKYEERLETFKEARRKGDANIPAPLEPVLRRLVVSDTTVEKLASVLQDNPRGTLVVRDELAGWFGSFAKYKSGNASSDLPNWLEMHRGGTVIVDRKSGDKPTLYIPRATVSVCGGIQPGTLARLVSPEYLESGLIARLLMAMPPKLPKQWTDEEVHPDIESAYHTCLENLLELGFDYKEGEVQPFELALSWPAKKLWINFYNWWAEEQAAAEGEMASALSKLESAAARLALVHHVVGHINDGKDDRCEIGTDSIEAGITLAKWFAAEARRIYAMFSETCDERDTRRLVEFIQSRGWRVTTKELQRSNDRKYPSAAVAECALESLVLAGLGAWVNRNPDKKGGRPTKDFLLVDAPDETDETSE